MFRSCIFVMVLVSGALTIGLVSVAQQSPTEASTGFDTPTFAQNPGRKASVTVLDSHLETRMQLTNPGSNKTTMLVLGSDPSLMLERARIVTRTQYEHDASLDRGEAYQEFFGDLHYTFDHNGVHFIVLDNVSDPTAAVGEQQLQWLQADLRQMKSDARIVVLTHRPLFDLAPDWDWATRDGAAVIDVLMQHPNVTVLYGHIHQEHHHMTGHIAHHAAKSLMWALPEPGSQPKKTQIPWNSAEPYKGLGFRNIEAEVSQAKYEIEEIPISRG